MNFKLLLVAEQGQIVTYYKALYINNGIDERRKVIRIISQPCLSKDGTHMK